MKMTQPQQIKEHLMKHGSITSWDAIQFYGITRLAEIVRRLKRKGMDIPASYHGKTNWARYKLIK